MEFLNDDEPKKLFTPPKQGRTQAQRDSDWQNEGHDGIADDFSDMKTPQQMLDMSRFEKPTSDAPHELADSVNVIKKAGLLTERYGWGYWLRMVKRSRKSHFEIKKLVEEDMPNAAAWVKSEHGNDLNCGAWLTNKLSSKKQS